MTHETRIKPNENCCFHYLLVKSWFDTKSHLGNLRSMKTATPLLISLAEAGYQLSLPQSDIVSLIRDGELVALSVRGQILVEYQSLISFTRRAKRNRDRTVAQLEPRGVSV